jgi:hypothetical protein
VQGESPFGPRAVVDPHAVASEQLGEHVPRRGGAAADRAIGDQLAAGIEIDRLQDLAECDRAAKRAPLVVEAVEWLMNRRGDVTGATARLHATGRPEPLAGVLGRRAHVEQRRAGFADRGPDGFPALRAADRAD